MSNSVVILDLETIPDRAVWSPPEVAPALPDDQCEKCNLPLSMEVSEARSRKCTKMERGKCRLPKVATSEEKSPFPPTFAHQICVVGFLLIEDGIPTAMASLAAAVPQEERDLLRHFNDFMTGKNPTLVTFNGRGFDMPVIQLRSFRHGVAQAWYGRNHANRYSEEGHIDLADILGDHRGPRSGNDLDAYSQLIGLPGKGDFNGALVEETVRGGGIDIVQGYCLTDVVKTAYLFFRYQLLRGQITVEQYKYACVRMRDLWLPAGEPLPPFKPWIDSMVGAWDFVRLELE